MNRMILTIALSLSAGAIALAMPVGKPSLQPANQYPTMQVAETGTPECMRLDAALREAQTALYNYETQNAEKSGTDEFASNSAALEADAKTLFKQVEDEGCKS